MNLRNMIKNYVPYNEQEIEDKNSFLKFLDTFEDVLTRDNIFGHFTSSAFVVNKDRTKMLVVYHNIYDGWVYPGGHADGEFDLLSVAVREVEEETGLKAKILDENIFGLQVNAVNGHVKRGKYISSHTHYDVVYLLEADDTLPLTYRIDESKGVKWILLEEAYNDEIIDSFKLVHKKLVYKLKELK